MREERMGEVRGNVSSIIGSGAVLESLELRRLLSVGLVKDLNPGLPGSFASDFQVVTNTLFFVKDGLWKSNGSAAGTTLLKGESDEFKDLSNLTNLNGTLYFTASYNPPAGNSVFPKPYLWRSNGTASGTLPVKDLGGTSVYGESFRGPLVPLNGSLYFANDALWKSDGTAAGTGPIKNVSPSGGGIAEANGKLYFNSDGGFWVSDGTTAGTRLIDSVQAGSIEAVGSSIFFQASDSKFNPELWITDGTENAAHVVKEIGQSIIGSSPSDLTSFGGKLYFSADDQSHGHELWVSDGTEAGTLMLKNIDTYSESQGFSGIGSSPADLTIIGNRIFFTADDVVHGRELWVTDGTEAGTVMVKDISVGSTSFGGLTGVGGRLYFSANDGVHGSELWQSDGTAAGTFMVADLNPGLSGSNVGHLADVQGTLFFTADNGIVGNELWKTVGPPFASLSSGGTLIASGTGGKDSFSITIDKKGRVLVTSNLGTLAFKKSQVKRLSINLGGGSDKLVIARGVSRVSIYGGGGNDTLLGGPGADFIDGGPGADRIFGGGGNDILIGGSGNDRLYGDAGSDNLSGGSGNDILVSRDGARDTLSGGSGTNYAQIDKKKLDTWSGIATLLV